MRSVHKLVPYADHTGDGLVQLGFTLATSNPSGAKKLAEKMGLENPEVIHKQPLTGELTYYLVYGQCVLSIDEDELEPEIDPQHMTKGQVEEMAAMFGRPLVVVGATTGTDTHTLGLDAMLNLKGYDGHKGLEAYKHFEVHNLGAQVSNEELAARAVELDADAILVSQTVTQQGLHVDNLKELIALVEGRFMFLACGGPRIDNKFARELGFDAGFGKGTLPNHVATAIVRSMLENRKDLIYASAAKHA
jgi:beta-lysine 5,6-aminomutase beta subunit